MMICRFDKIPLTHEFVDLGFSPPSNSFLTSKQLNEPEIYYPLKLYVSERSFLVQIDEYKQASEIFSGDYVYYSSYSTSWLAHSKRYVDMMIRRFGFNNDHLVVEIASNDGYLLQYFKEADVPVLGIEPTAGTAAVAKEKGIESWIEFFGVDLAKKMTVKGKKADLLLGNNVLAHVPDINDFVAGLKIALKDSGIITMEFPHLMKLVEFNQFDTIYHEHFSYLSLLAVQKIFEHHGLVIFDVEELTTHGGSLRIFASHREDKSHAILPAVKELLDREIERGMNTIGYYQGFQRKVDKVKNDFLAFLLLAKKSQQKVVGYGAAAKGNTLMNYAGIKKDLVEYVADANPHKQNRFLPGNHIPVVGEKLIRETKPAFVLILPWNIQEEITKQLSYIRDWDGKFVTAIPELSIF